MTESLGVVVPAYDPDIRALTRYITAIRELLEPAVIRVEIDTPREDHLTALDPIVDDLSDTKTKRGKGGAIIDGFNSLETDIFAFADADGSVPASSLDKIVHRIRTGTADISIGSRRHPSSHIVSHQTIIRRLLGDIFALVAQQLLPTRCRDYQCGAKAVRADAWAEIRHYCHEQGFAWDLEFVSVAGSLGYDITEVPVVWTDHPDSTVDPIRTSVELATALLAVRRRTRPLTPYRRLRDQPTDHTDYLHSKDGN